MNKQFMIEGTVIGQNAPCFIIAEVGVNHNGNMDLAFKLIEEAARAGVGAVKFQAFITEELITPETPKAGYQIENTGQQGGQYAMLKGLELTSEQHAQLKHHCEAHRILYLCTPYDHSSADMLENIGVAAYKVASTDTTNLPFLHHLAFKGKPLILSTGMSTLAEVEAAVNTVQQSGADFALLQCTSEYPAPIQEVNLRAIQTLKQAFGCPVGFSDHTEGIDVATWATILGASIIEKHFTLDCNLPGPDHRASLEPAQLAQMVRNIRLAEAALGDGIKRPMPSELPNKAVMQKSLIARRFIPAQAVITADDVVCKRPGTGLPPSMFEAIVGRKAAQDIEPETILNYGHIIWA